LVGAALALMLALTWGGVRYGWASWGIVGLLVGSAVLWILFVARLLTAREPFIPVVILRGRVTGAITCASFFAIGTVIGVTIYTPLYCQVVLGASASAIVIGGAGDAASVMMLGKLAGGHGDFASAFRFVFIAAAVCLAVALACVLAVEERPLHGPVRLADPAAE
jgi:hypothetical protein